MKAKDLIDETMGKAQTLDSDQLSEFFLHMSILSTGVLRGLHGEQYAKGYLKAALEDKKPIVIKAHRNH